MIEFKFDKERREHRLSASGSVIEIAAEMCVIIEQLRDIFKKHNAKDGQIYLLIVKMGIDRLCKEVNQ